MEELVTIATYQLVAEADLARATLEDEGITTYLADDNLVAMDWMLSNAIGGIKLQVAREQAEQATRILEVIKQRRRENPSAPKICFDCEECGNPLSFGSHRRGGVETCDHCGCYVDVPE